MQKTAVLIFMFLALAVSSLALPAVSAAAGQFYITKGGDLAAHEREDLIKASRFASQNDIYALKRMLSSGRVILLKKGIPVRVENMNLLGGVIKIRVKGYETPLWTYRKALKRISY